MKCKLAQEALSDFLEGGLDPPRHQEIADHLLSCDRCAREERELAQMMRVVRERVGRREPVLDLWAEFVPKLAAVRAEERLGLAARLQLRAGRFFHNVAYGAILFTQALAMNTAERMQKYLLADPFHHDEIEEFGHEQHAS